MQARTLRAHRGVEQGSERLLAHLGNELALQYQHDHTDHAAPTNLDDLQGRESAAELGRDIGRGLLEQLSYSLACRSGRELLGDASHVGAEHDAEVRRVSERVSDVRSADGLEPIQRARKRLPVGERVTPRRTICGYSDGEHGLCMSVSTLFEGAVSTANEGVPVPVPSHS